MNSKIKTLNLPNYEEALPSYEEYDANQSNFPIGSSSGSEYISTYKLTRGGLLWSEYICKDYLKRKELRVKTRSTSGELLIDDVVILKLKNMNYQAKKVNWDIVYIIKNPERYSKLLLTRSNFNLNCYFLSLAKYDGQVIEYDIHKSNTIPIRWVIHPKGHPNNIILKYNFGIIGNSKLNQTSYIHEEDFKLFFLVLCFILSYEL